MLTIKKMALVAAAAVCVAQPAQAAVTFTLAPGDVAGFSASDTGFTVSFFTETVAPTSFQGILTAFAGAGPCTEFCVPYSPYRMEVINRTALPGGVFQTFSISVATSTGPIFDRVFRIVNTGSNNITFRDFTSVRDVLSPIPEPTTWTLMLAGFAMTGYALRRRRAKVAFA